MLAIAQTRKALCRIFSLRSVNAVLLPPSQAIARWFRPSPKPAGFSFGVYLDSHKIHPNG
jgi:hypothetical protein